MERERVRGPLRSAREADTADMQMAWRTLDTILYASIMPSTPPAVRKENRALIGWLVGSLESRQAVVFWMRLAAWQGVDGWPAAWLPARMPGSWNVSLKSIHKQSIYTIRISESIWMSSCFRQRLPKV